HYSINEPNTIDKLDKFQLLINSLKCSNTLYSNSPIEYAGALNQCVEVILRTGIADISFADSLLEIESKILRVDSIDLKNIFKENSFNEITIYYNLVGLSILKKSDTTLTQSALFSLKKLVNQLEIITENFTDFKNIPENQINSFLLIASQYFYHSKDPKLNKILNLYRQKVSQSISKAVNFMTESELSQFIQNEIFSKTDIFFELYDPNIMADDYTSFLFQLALQTKGLLMRKSTELNKFIAESKDSSIVSLFSKLSALELQIKNSPDQKSILFKQKETYERECLRLLRSTHKEDSFNISLLKEKLNKGEIAVEFIKYKSSFRKNSPEKYMALVLDSERLYPVAIPLFEESQLLNSNAYLNISKTTESELASNSNARGTGLKPVKDNNHSHHYKLIWEPILKTFPETKLINFSSVGILNTLNLNSLSITKNETMIDKYKLRQFTNTYNYTTISVNQPKVFDKVLLVGGLEYGENSQISKIEDQLHWNYLPGTLTETKSIHELMRKKNLNTTLISGLQAREEIVTEFLKESYDIIHIATHGYYYNIQTVSNNSKNHSHSNPLFNSMLVLSDANSIAKKDIFTKNGYLNAYEISCLDLSKTKIVVLSACETGVGLNTNRYESTFSLVRGLKIAGAENIVASLWSVSDRSTIQFMTKLYSNLLNTNYSVSEAFQITQQQVKAIQSNDSNWSAFILIN
ncbi:MAG: CHAT domain-containing protein, partial [Saprospiraceae bacterium]|nr:CHAT domain-containing protein [Saprospiraceae bacterium]